MLLVIQLSRKFGTGEQNAFVDIFPNVHMRSDRVGCSPDQVSMFNGEQRDDWQVDGAGVDQPKCDTSQDVTHILIRRSEHLHHAAKQ